MTQLSPSCAVVMKALPAYRDAGISHKMVLDRCEVLCQQKQGTSSAALNKLAKMGYVEKSEDQLWTRSERGESMMKNLKDMPIEEVEKALEPSPESLAAVHGCYDVANIGKVADEELEKMDKMVKSACDPEWEADLRHVLDKIKYHEIPSDAINAYGLMVDAMPESVRRVLQPITDMVLRQDRD